MGTQTPGTEALTLVLFVLLCVQLYRSMRAFVADTIYLAGEVLLHDKGLVLVPQVRLVCYICYLCVTCVSHGCYMHSCSIA
jgi:hypothetical protein